MKKSIKTLLTIITILVIMLFISRLTSPREIDDIHPKWICEQEYINKSTTLWIMPMWGGSPISENKVWCEEMKKSNKTFGMHGIQSWYQEFNEEVNENDFIEAIDEYEKCLGKKPTIFKAPALKISPKNKKLVEKYNMSLRTPYHQAIHKVYHCQDTGTLPNWFHDLF